MISVCILAKNEQNCIHQPILSTIKYVEEIILVDDHSEDDTPEVAQNYGAKVYELPFNVSDKGFSEAANWMLDKASSEWVLILDSDEIMENPLELYDLIELGKDVWSLPRRKWSNFAERIRTEYEMYPDWQIRFFKNKPHNRFRGEMHVRWTGDPISFAYSGPHIEHLQDELRNPHKIEHRKQLYEKLADIQGVKVFGGDTKQNDR